MVTEINSDTHATTKVITKQNGYPINPVDLFEEIAAVAAQHGREHVALTPDDIVYRHEIQALSHPATPWEISRSIPREIRGDTVTDADILNQFMGINGSFDRLVAAGALSPQERANVRDLKSFLAGDPRYQGMLQVEPATLRQAIDMGIHVAETLPGNYQPEDRAIILTGGLKYLAEGYGYLGTRERALPQFGGKWGSLGVSSLDMLTNQHMAITQFPQETRGFVTAYQHVREQQQQRKHDITIVWPPLGPRTPAASASRRR